MGTPRTPAPVRLVIGILAANQSQMDQSVDLLCSQFGEVDHQLGPIPFRWTNYYQDELGDAPIRCILAFTTTIDRLSIPDLKLWTNAQEDLLRKDGQRVVNLDPGYMTMGQFFLATTKDQRQRVYVRDGIYVEPTLYFENGKWQAFPWTYRDWQSEEYLAFFQVARQRFAYQRTTGKSWANRAGLE